MTKYGRMRGSGPLRKIQKKEQMKEEKEMAKASNRQDAEEFRRSSGRTVLRK